MVQAAHKVLQKRAQEACEELVLPANKKLRQSSRKRTVSRRLLGFEVCKRRLTEKQKDSLETESVMDATATVPAVDDHPVSATSLSVDSVRELDVDYCTDGSCIITLPDNFCGDAFVNIHGPLVEKSHAENNQLISMQAVNEQGNIEDNGDGSAQDSSHDSHSDHSITEEPLKVRKRIRRCAVWKKNVRKMKRLKGQEYISDKTKQTVRARSLKPVNCGKCRLGCSTKVSEEQRQKLFHEFYSMSSWEAQTAYLKQSIMEYEPKRRTTQADSNRKAHSRAYYVTVTDGSSSRSVRICKNMFMKTYDINTARIHYALTRKRTDVTDGRGKQGSVGKTPANQTAAVRNHISQFPRHISHYSRHRTSKEYLRGVSGIADMYRLYVEQCKSNGTESVSEWVYRRIFNTEYNLAFHVPKSDTCKRCDIFSAKSGVPDVNQDAVRDEWNSHLEAAERTRAKLNVDKQRAHMNDGSALVFTFDLQKTKPLPFLQTNEAYYKRQLSVYNFGIHDCGSGKGYFHMWHEACASRGSAEIASCLWVWLNKMKSEYQQHQSTFPSNLIAYSDSCGGQNRNIIIAVFWMHVLHALHLDCIDHIFMVSGHSFLPCDEDFGVDEKQKRKSEPVFTLHEWMELALRARKSNKFDVMEMEQFLDFKQLVRQCVNRKVNANGEKVEWLRIRWMRFVKAIPGTSGFILHYKYSVDDEEEFEVVDMTRKGRRGRCHTRIDELPNMYPAGRSISAAKFSDLKSLLKYVPPTHHPFYMNLPHQQRAVPGPEVSDDIFDDDSDAVSDVEDSA